MLALHVQMIRLRLEHKPAQLACAPCVQVKPTNGTTHEETGPCH